MPKRPIASPAVEAHRIIRNEISRLCLTEIETRLVSFSLREISRAHERINSIPSLSPAEARDLYHRLLRAFVIEHDTRCVEPRSRRAA
jgi:hypothetical protein